MTISTATMRIGMKTLTTLRSIGESRNEVAGMGWRSIAITVMFLVFITTWAEGTSLASTRGRFLSLDAGAFPALAWVFKAPLRHWIPPEREPLTSVHVIGNSALAYSPYNGIVFQVDIASGTLSQKHELGNPGVTSDLVVNNHLAVQTWLREQNPKVAFSPVIGEVVGYDVQTWRLKWKVALPEEPRGAYQIKTPAVIDDEDSTVYITIPARTKGHLIALSAIDGRTLWKRDIDGSVGMLEGQPTIVLYNGPRNSDRENSRLRWNHTTWQSNESTTAQSSKPSIMDPGIRTGKTRG